MTNPDRSVGHPAEFVDAFDAVEDAWQFWWLQPDHVRDLYVGWVRQGRTPRVRRLRANHTADYAARGLLAASVQPARPRRLAAEVAGAAVDCLVVGATGASAWFLVTAAAGAEYQWYELVGLVEIGTGLTAASATGRIWRHRRAPIASGRPAGPAPPAAPGPPTPARRRRPAQ